jgi:hypothetical protein
MLAVSICVDQMGTSNSCTGVGLRFVGSLNISDILQVLIMCEV